MAERKRYITVKVPILKNEMRILGTPEELHDKTIKLDLTRKLRGKGLTLKLRIFNKEGELFAIPDRMELTASYIKRMMRKRISYVEDSFTVRCKDVKATVKPFLITRKKVSRVVRKNLRNTAREFILEYSKDKEYIDICQEILAGTFQKTMLPKLKKVYPLSFCDLRIFETKELANVDLNKATILEENLEESEEEEGIEIALDEDDESESSENADEAEEELEESEED